MHILLEGKKGKRGRGGGGGRGEERRGVNCTFKETLMGVHLEFEFSSIMSHRMS